MEHLMHQLVGRSITQERDRDLALRAAQRRVEPAAPAKTSRQDPPRHRSGRAPVVAHA